MGPSNDRRALILEIAARLFRHYGHAKTTIADIAREARVAVGSVYLDFDSKEAIVEALSSLAYVRVLDAMRHAARRSERSFAARVAAVFHARTATFLEIEREGVHSRELVHCHADGVKLARVAFDDDERAFLRQLLEDAADAGEIAILDPRSTAALLQRAYATLSPPLLFDLGTDRAAASSVAMAELLLEGLLPRMRVPKKRKR